MYLTQAIEWVVFAVRGSRLVSIDTTRGSTEEAVLVVIIIIIIIIIIVFIAIIIEIFIMYNQNHENPYNPHHDRYPKASTEECVITTSSKKRVTS